MYQHAVECWQAPRVKGRRRRGHISGLTMKQRSIRMAGAIALHRAPWTSAGGEKAGVFTRLRVCTYCVLSDIAWSLRRSMVVRECKSACIYYFRFKGFVCRRGGDRVISCPLSSCAARASSSASLLFFGVCWLTSFLGLNENRFFVGAKRRKPAGTGVTYL